jgi:poly(hydroxyalkanoate) depolymerase family esterase
MSSIGWRRFAERTARRRAAAHQHRSAKGRGRWTPRRLTFLRWRRPAPAGAQVGTWDQLVDETPTGSRSFAVYTPPGLRAGTAVPLVVILHGCKQSAEDAALGTGANALADREGFVALYPQQSAHDNPQRCWNWFNPRHQVRGFGEPAEIARITERVLGGHAGARLDRNRVHVMGISAGGAMAGILGATYPDVYASIGIHSAPQYRAARSALTALLAMKNGGPNPQRQGRLAHLAMGPRARIVPVIVFQGDADRTVWAANGDRVVRQWLTTSKLAGVATLLDFARPHTIHDDRAPGGLTYSVRSWNDNAGRPVVQYWTVSGLGHAWSGGTAAGSYTDPRGPNATEAMWHFFTRCSQDRDLAAARQQRPVVDARTRRAAVGRTVKELGRRSRRLLRPNSAPTTSPGGEALLTSPNDRQATSAGNPTTATER